MISRDQLLTLGPKRLKMVLGLVEHPEIDEDPRSGSITFHWNTTGLVREEIHRYREIRTEQSA